MSTTGRVELLRAHGADPIAYSTLQPGLEYFDTSYGYLAYARAAGFALTLGPPICARADRAALLEGFFARVKRPVVFYVQRDDAELAKALGGFGYGLCPIGADKVLSLDAPLDTDAKVKSAVKKAKKGGLAMHEQLPARELLERVDAEYFAKSAVPVEMRFLNRPVTLEADGLGRLFVLSAAGEPFGYAALDPYFQGGQATGYLLNVLRFAKTSLWGVYYAAVASLAEALKGEGVRQLSLGFCPLGAVDAAGCSPRLAAQAKWMEARFGAVPYLQRLKEMKDAFPGPSPQRYFVGRSPLVATTLLALLKACGVPLLPIVKHQLSDVARRLASRRPAA